MLILTGVGALLVVAFCALHRTPSPLLHLYAAAVLCTGVSVPIGPGAFGVEFLSLALVPLVLRRLPRREAAPSLAGWVLACAWALVAVSSAIRVAIDAPASIWIAAHMFSAMIVALLLVDRDCAALRSALLNVGAAIAGWSILAYLARGAAVALPKAASGVGPDGRLIGFSLETNLFASQCVLLLVLAVASAQERGRSHGRLVAFTLAVAVLMAGTRAAWVALVLVLTYTGLRAMRQSRYALPIATTFGPVLAAGAMAFAVYTNDNSQNSLYWRATHIFDTASGTGAYRVAIYQKALADMDSPVHWLLGAGVNVFGQFHPVDATNNGAEYLSSIWVATLYETGIVGSICLLGLLFFFSARSPTSSWMIVLASLICASTTNLFWFQYAWVTIAACCSVPSPTRLPVPSARERENSSSVSVR